MPKIPIIVHTIQITSLPSKHFITSFPLTTLNDRIGSKILLTQLSYQKIFFPLTKRATKLHPQNKPEKPQKEINCHSL